MGRGWVVKKIVAAHSRYSEIRNGGMICEKEMYERGED